MPPENKNLREHCVKAGPERVTALSSRRHPDTITQRTIHAPRRRDSFWVDFLFSWILFWWQKRAHASKKQQVVTGGRGEGCTGRLLGGSLLGISYWWSSPRQGSLTGADWLPPRGNSILTVSAGNGFRTDSFSLCLLRWATHIVMLLRYWRADSEGEPAGICICTAAGRMCSNFLSSKSYCPPFGIQLTWQNITVRCESERIATSPNILSFQQFVSFYSLSVIMCFSRCFSLLLARNHYNNFSLRFHSIPFPPSVGSRFLLPTVMLYTFLLSIVEILPILYSKIIYTIVLI